jgi:hypothetical protein
MRRLQVAVAAVGFAVLASASPAAAGGLVEAGELEAARANARAGGPISERDAELLERYGCLSGTRNPFCQALTHRRYRHHTHRRRSWRD